MFLLRVKYFAIRTLLMLCCYACKCAVELGSSSCHHVPPKEYEVLHGVDVGGIAHGLTKRSTYQSLQIHLHHDDTIKSLSHYHQEQIKEYVPHAVRYWEETLQSHHSADTIKLRRRCRGGRMQYLQSQPRVPYCSMGCIDATKCGHVDIPAAHLDRCYTCDGDGGCRLEGDATIGVRNSHFVLYVSAVHTSRCLKGRTIAYSAHCQLEKSLDRPVAGFLNVCPESLTKVRLQDADLLSTLKHEILHALGFTAGLYAFYRDENGEPYTSRNAVTNKPLYNQTLGLYMWSEAVVRSIQRDSWLTSRGYMTRIVDVIVTPNVKREVRQHFNCSSLEGAEIENQESGGTALTHWEKRVFENEAMTGTYTQNPVISRITLALMHDTGWYLPKYENAEDLTWGKNLGCDFVTKSCLSWIVENEKLERSVHPFCTRARQSNLQTECSLNRESVTVCNLQRYPPSYNIPPQYVYFSSVRGFPDADASHFGGSVVLADYCPYIQEITWKKSDETWRSSRCRDPSNNHDPEYNYLVEKYGNTSKCFDHGGPFTLQQCDQSVLTQHWGAACYQYECSEAGLLIQVGAVKHLCQSSGHKIHVSHRSQHWLHTGVIVCPKCREICPALSCARVSSSNLSWSPYVMVQPAPCSQAQPLLSWFISRQHSTVTLSTVFIVTWLID